MAHYNKEQIRKEVYEAFHLKWSDAEVRQLIAEQTGLKKSAKNELFRTLKAEYATAGITVASVEQAEVKEEKPTTGLVFTERYTYNAESDQYVVFLKSVGKNTIIPGLLHRNMLKAYSNWNGDPSSITTICRNFGITKKVFEEYKAIMGWSHDHEPIAKEVLKDGDVEVLSEDLIQQKRFALQQSFEKKDWAQTVKDALSWKEYRAGVLDPFDGFINTADFKSYGRVADCKITPTAVGGTLVVGLSDIHCGSLAEARYIYSGKNWDIKEYNKAIADYVSQLYSKIDNLRDKPKKIVIACLGDILHGLFGETQKGTPLTCDRVKDSQFDAAFDSLTYFVSSMGSLAQEIEVQVVTGNHDGVIGRILFKTLAAYYRNDQRVKFTIADTDVHAFKVESTLVMLSHGASADYKAKLPAKGKARDSYIQSYLLAKPELLIDVKQKIFITGDLHSFEHSEATDFEFYRFSTFVKADLYAEALNLHSRPRQNCLLINSTGVSEVWHLYFD